MEIHKKPPDYRTTEKILTILDRLENENLN